jgi:cytochrome b
MLRTDEDPELLVFDPVIRFFHWLTLFLVATIFVLAFSIDFASSKEEAVALIQLHRSFGVTVWVVMLARLVWRQFSRFPNWPADTDRHALPHITPTKHTDPDSCSRSRASGFVLRRRGVIEQTRR